MTRARYVLALAVLVLAALVAPAVARAQPPAGVDAPTDESDEAAARRAFEEGEALLHAGRFVEGRDRLRRSLALYSHPSTAYNLALAYRGTGEATAGLALSTELMEGRYGELPPEARAEVAALIEQLEAMTATLRVDNAEDVEVVLTVDARDTVAMAARAELELRLDAGDHAVVARAPGRIPFEEAIHLEAGERETISLALSLLPERADDTPLHVGLVVAGATVVAAAVAVVTYLLVASDPAPETDPVFGVAVLPGS